MAKNWVCQFCLDHPIHHYVRYHAPPEPEEAARPSKEWSTADLKQQRAEQEKKEKVGPNGIVVVGYGVYRL